MADWLPIERRMYDPELLVRAGLGKSDERLSRLMIAGALIFGMRNLIVVIYEVTQTE